MATLNKGILTTAGLQLFGQVEKGDAQITYTKVVFCDDQNLLNMDDQDIRQLSDINPTHEIKCEPVAFNDGLVHTQDGRTAIHVAIRAVATNAGEKDAKGNVVQQPVTEAFTPYVSALYASDGNKEILYGLYLKQKPGEMPAYDGVTPQPLEFIWDLFTLTTDNFDLDNKSDIYATLADLASIQAKYKEFAEDAKASMKRMEAELQNDFDSKLSNIDDINAKLKMLSGYVPAAPQLQAIMATNNGTIHYSLTQPAKKNSSNVYQYHVYYKLTTDSNYQEVTTTDTFGSIPNLDATKEYNVYAVAENAAGLSDQSNQIETGKANVPDAPTLQASMDTSKATITYTIKPGNDGGASIDNYNLFYKKDSDANYAELQTDGTTGTLTNLNPKSKYNLYVQAINLAGTSQPSNTVTTDIIDSNIYGITTDDIYSDPSLNRTDASAELPHRAGVNGQPNDFDNYSVWKLMRIVYDSKGNKFVRIPAFWIYKAMSGNSLTVKISLTNHGRGWYKPQVFKNHTTGADLSYFDFGCYDASDNGQGGLASITGATPLVDKDMADFRSMARNLGTGYQLMDVHAWDAIKCLFIVEFATLNSQAVMKGYCYDNNASNAENNGATDNDTGSSNTSSNGTMNYRGIENLYGNVWTWLDGEEENGTQLYVCDDPTQYQDNVFANPYVQVGYALPSNGGNITQLGFDPNHPEANLPVSFDGSNNQNGFCDYGGVGYSGSPVFYVGSYWGVGDDGGLFYCYYDEAGSTSDYIGARLIKKAVY